MSNARTERTFGFNVAIAFGVVITLAAVLSGGATGIFVGLLVVGAGLGADALGAFAPVEQPDLASRMVAAERIGRRLAATSTPDSTPAEAESTTTLAA